MSHYNDPQDSTPYEDEDLIQCATNNLDLEFKEMSTKRSIGYISSLELADVAFWWLNNEMGVLHQHFERLRKGFIDHYLDSEIDAIIDNSKMDAAEAYADYLEDR